MRTPNSTLVLRILPIPILFIIFYLFTQLRIHSEPPLQGLASFAPSSSQDETTATAPSLNLTETKSTFSTEAKDFWNDLARALEEVRPRCPALQIEDGHPTSKETTFEPLNSAKMPPARLVNFTDEHEAALLESHYLMRTSAQRLAPRLVFSKDGHGIVTTANAKYIPIFLVSLRMLRKTGCQLPVEVFIDNWTKYDPVICEAVLPSLNAACVVLSEIYDTAPNVQQPTSYQFKLFAILFSSFQHVLFLDSDAFPAHDPTDLFDVPPYTTHGLVVWPDLFGLTINEHYYHIAAIPYEPPSSRASTESSIVLLDKERHRESFLMMVYYNYYGPDFYYPLLCQGSHGAGDKETFVQAAMAVGAPWYQVKTGVAGLGYFEGKDYRLSGLAQMDPRSDFLYQPPSKSHIHPNAQWEVSGIQKGEEISTHPKPLFVHQNMHKFNPARILLMDGTTAKTKDGNYTRMWGNANNIVKMFGYDIERRVWEVIVEEGCRSDNETEVCASLGKYYTEVFGTTHSVDE